MGSNYNRINKIKPFLQHFNSENINHPLEKEDYKTFESNNESISLIVYRLDNERKKVHYYFKSEHIATM